MPPTWLLWRARAGLYQQYPLPYGLPQLQLPRLPIALPTLSWWLVPQKLLTWVRWHVHAHVTCGM